MGSSPFTIFTASNASDHLTCVATDFGRNQSRSILQAPLGDCLANTLSNRSVSVMLSVRHIHATRAFLMCGRLKPCEIKYCVSLVVSPTATSMSVSIEPKHPLIDTNASNRLLHTGNSSGLPLNLGTACFILLNSRGPTFTPELSTDSSYLISSTCTPPGACKFPPVTTPSWRSLPGLDWASPRPRSLAIRSSSRSCRNTNDLSKTIISSCEPASSWSCSLPGIVPIQTYRNVNVLD